MEASQPSVLPTAPPATITMGETNCNLSGTDNNAGLLLRQRRRLTQAGNAPNPIVLRDQSCRPAHSWIEDSAGNLIAQTQLSYLYRG